MSCNPIHISLEVDPDAADKIVITLDKTCDDNDDATWKITFVLQQGDPLVQVVNFSVEIDPDSHDKAQATADNGLDDAQQGQAQIAAGVHTDPDATDDDKNAATQQVIAVRGS